MTSRILLAMGRTITSSSVTSEYAKYARIGGDDDKVCECHADDSESSEQEDEPGDDADA